MTRKAGETQEHWYRHYQKAAETIIKLKRENELLRLETSRLGNAKQQIIDLENHVLNLRHKIAVLTAALLRREEHRVKGLKDAAVAQ